MRRQSNGKIITVIFSLFFFWVVVCSSLPAQGNGENYISYPTGFADSSQIRLNGSASVIGSGIQLTDGKQFESGSFFYKQRVPIEDFTTSFDFQLTDATADGFAFVVQGLGPDALGSSGGGLGYGNPPGGTGAAIGYAPASLEDTSSLAVAFDLHNNLGEGSNSIRLEGSGVTAGGLFAVDLTPYGLDLHSGHRFHAQLTSFSGLVNYIPTGGIMVALTDLQTSKTATVLAQYSGGIRNIVGSGYAGFTGGTGVGTATQTIYNWSFGPPPGTVQTTLSQTTTAPTSSTVLYPNGFAALSGFELNGGASVGDSVLQLTHGREFEATSVFSQSDLAVGMYRTDFDFDLGDGSGDGFTFVVQGGHHGAIGSSGGGLGYGPDKPGGEGALIPLSYALKFDLHNNAGEGTDSTGVYFNGSSPTVPAVDMSSSINLHSGHTYHARLILDADGAVPVLVLALVDLTEFRVFHTSFEITGAVGFSQYASIGYTAGSGATPSNVRILNWTYIGDL